MAEIPNCSHMSTPFIPVAHRYHFLATLLPSFLPDFCSFLPFLLLRPNSCGPVTFGLQALVELHMRLQENSEYKLSRALNTTCYSQKVEPADKLLHVSIFREKNRKVIFQSQRGMLFKSIGIDSENTECTSQTEPK